MNESISRAAGAAHGQECPPEVMEAAIHAAGRVARAAHDAVRRRAGRSHRCVVRRRAPSSRRPSPPYDDGGLERPRRLVRPGLVGVA